MKNRKESYLEEVEDVACTINSLALIASFVGIIGTGILAMFTSILIPLIVSSSIFGASFVDYAIGKATSFKEKDISPYYPTRGETRNHGDKETQTVPPLIYGALALPSLFISDKPKDEKSNNNTNNDNEYDALSEDRKRVLAEKNSSKETAGKTKQQSQKNEIVDNQIKNNEVVTENNNQLEM